MNITPYYVVPRALRNFPGMTLEIMDVYETVNSHVDNLPSGTPFGINEIEEITGLDEQAILGAFRFLQGNGLIKDVYVNYCLKRREK